MRRIGPFLRRVAIVERLLGYATDYFNPAKDGVTVTTVRTIAFGDVGE